MEYANYIAIASAIPETAKCGQKKKHLCVRKMKNDTGKGKRKHMGRAMLKRLKDKPNRRAQGKASETRPGRCCSD